MHIARPPPECRRFSSARACLITTAGASSKPSSPFRRPITSCPAMLPLPRFRHIDARLQSAAPFASAASASLSLPHQGSLHATLRRNEIESPASRGRARRQASGITTMSLPPLLPCSKIPRPPGAIEKVGRSQAPAASPASFTAP